MWRYLDTWQVQHFACTCNLWIVQTYSALIAMQTPHSIPTHTSSHAFNFNSLFQTNTGNSMTNKMRSLSTSNIVEWTYQLLQSAWRMIPVVKTSLRGLKISSSSVGPNSPSCSTHKSIGVSPLNSLETFK